MVFIPSRYQPKAQTKKNIPQKVQDAVDEALSPSGVQHLASHPFFQKPDVSNVTPLMTSGITYSKAPINSSGNGFKMGGAISTNLFNIDFGKSKANKANKKVHLKI